MKRGDFRASELGLAAVATVLVLGGAAMGLTRAARGASEKAASAAPVEPTEIPIRVAPVMDLDAPLLKLGGAPEARRSSERWVKPSARPRAERKAVVSSRASKAAEDAPPPDVAPAKPEEPPPPPEAEITKKVDAPVASASAPPANEPAPAPVASASAAAGVPGPGHADGVKEGTETDPLKARAVDLYRAKIAGWFATRFRVKGSGLPREELLKYRVAATIDVADDRTVTGFSITPSGNASFDAAANTALEGARGQSLPAPPENYPDVGQRRIHITFVCRENRCD